MRINELQVPLTQLPGVGTTDEIRKAALEVTAASDVAGKTGRLEFHIDDIPGESLRRIFVILDEALVANTQPREYMNSYVLLYVKKDESKNWEGK